MIYLENTSCHRDPVCIQEDSHSGILDPDWYTNGNSHFEPPRIHQCLTETKGFVFKYYIILHRYIQRKESATIGALVQAFRKCLAVLRHYYLNSDISKQIAEE